MTITETLYTVLNNNLQADVYLQGAVKSAPSVVIAYPDTLGRTTLDRFVDQRHTVTIRAHTLHPVDQVNSAAARDLVSSIKTALGESFDYNGFNVFVPAPDESVQQYERNGQTAHDKLLTYTFLTPNI